MNPNETKERLPSAPAALARGLSLNVAPIQFPDVSVRAGVVPYVGREQISSLRREHGGTHVIRRSGMELIAVPVVADAPMLGETRDIPLKADPFLTANLVNHAFARLLRDVGRRVVWRSPVEFVSDGRGEDLLSLAAPTTPSWLGVKPRYEMDVRRFFMDGMTPFLGVAINVSTVNSITRPCADFLREGFQMRGLYVWRPAVKDDPLVDARRELIGRVKEVSGTILILDDARSGVDQVDAGTVFLEGRREVFDRCLDHVFKGRALEVKTALDQRLAAIHGGPGALEKVQRVLGYFSKKNLELVPGVVFGVGEFIAQQRGAFPEVRTAPPVIYVFDPTGQKTDQYNSRGIDRYGPHTAQTFTPTRPRVCVVCVAERKARVEQFLHKFLHGIPASGGKPGPFVNGLIRKYHLEDVQVDFFTADRNSPDAFRDAATRAIEKGVKWDLALVEVDGSSLSLHGQDNSYLVTKSVFLTHQVPVQEFRVQTVGQADSQLAWVLSNMALATYAKLGGIPWLIKADRSIAHELVIGLGSAEVAGGRLTTRERFVGITTVFTGEGNYCLSNMSQAVPFAGYKDALLKTLEGTIEAVRQEMNWQSKDQLRLIFHAFKPMKDIEVEAVKETMARLVDYDVEYAFVHIVDDHPYVLFDHGQRGIGGSKGVLVPERGQYLRLSKSEMLISVTGPKELKKPGDGMPRPILLRLHRLSTFQDTTYLARQAYCFSGHSWRAFLPSSMPVTIGYSQLIARMLGKLSTLPRWNPEAMVGKIGKGRWFL